MSDIVLLKNVRCSFPHLFTRPIINGNEGKCGVTLLLDPKTPEGQKHIKAVREVVERTIKNTTAFKNITIPAAKRCLRDGNEETRAEYRGLWIVSTNHKTRPIVLGADGRTAVTSEEECEIYAGCYVNCKIQIWAQNNSHGKRINATPVAIQFAGHGEPLGNGFVSPTVAMEGFDSVVVDAFGDEAANDQTAYDEYGFM